MAVSTKIQHRRDTAANWTSTNPTLASGEIGFETDTLKFKIGNGSTAWNSLAYQGSSATGTVTSITASSPLTGGTITTSGTIGINASSANTANYVVQRDASGNFAANTITANLFGTANLATYIVGGLAGSIPYQNAANSTTFLAGATGTNSFLMYASGVPFWSTPTSSMAYLNGFSQWTTAGGFTSLDNTSSYYQQFIGGNTQTVGLPNTATLRTGWTFHIVNNSSANVTANTFGNAATLITIPSGTTAMVTCVATANNTSSAWEYGLTDFSSYTGTGSVVMNTTPTFSTLKLASVTQTASAGQREFDGTVFYSTTSTTPGKALDVASYYYVSNAQYVIDSTSAALPLSLLGASSKGITVDAGTTYEYEGLFVISASFIVTSQTPTINLISTTVSGSPVVAHQTVVESGNNATGLGSASTLSAYRFTTTGIALTALTTGSRYYTVKMRGVIRVTGTGTVEIYPSIRFSAGSTDNAWIVQPGSIFKLTPIGNGTAINVGTFA